MSFTWSSQCKIINAYHPLTFGLSNNGGTSEMDVIIDKAFCKEIVASWLVVVENREIGTSKEEGLQ